MIFMDAGAWIALSVPGDRSTEAARAFYPQIERGLHGAMVTTSFVLDEAATLIRMASDVETAVAFLRTVLGDPSVTVVWIDSGHFGAALDIFERHRDKRWSVTDCTSFAIMHELGISEAFSFDRDFEQAGFERLP